MNPYRGIVGGLRLFSHRWRLAITAR